MSHDHDMHPDQEPAPTSAASPSAASAPAVALPPVPPLPPLPPLPPAHPASAAPPAPRLALLEVLDRDGRCLRALDVNAFPLHIGRALNQQLVLDDEHVAPLHATLDIDAQGQLLLQVGDSVNGVLLGSQHLRTGQRLPLPPRARGTLLQLGHTRLLLRQHDDPLAREKPMAAHLLLAGTGLARQTRRLWWVAAALMALLVLQHGISLDPGADLTTWLPALVGLPAAVMTWCAGWALLSKLFQHRFEFGAHLRIALPGLLLIEVVDLLLPLLAASLGWSLLWRLAPPLRVLLMAWVVYRHLALLLPQQPARAAAAVIAATLVGGAINLVFTERSTDRLSAPAYMSTLPMPLLNFAGVRSSDQLIQDLVPLSQRLQERAKKARDEADADEGSD